MTKTEMLYSTVERVLSVAITETVEIQICVEFTEFTSDCIIIHT